MRSPGTQPAAAAEDAAAPRREAVSGSGSGDLTLPPPEGAWLPPRPSALPSLGHALRSSGLPSGPSGKPNRSPPPSSPEATPLTACPAHFPRRVRGAGPLPRPHHAQRVPPSGLK